MAETATPANPETLRAARRSPASHLAPTFESGSVPGIVALKEIPFQTMVGIRVDRNSDAGARIASVTGGLPAACGEISGDERATTLWLGPEEFLVVDTGIGPRFPGRRPGPRTGGGPGRRPGPGGGLVRQPHHLRAVRLPCPGRPGKGCSLDLHPRAFRTGTALATEIGNIPAMLLKTGEDSFRIFPRASFAEFLGRWLLDGMRDSPAPRFPDGLSVLDLFSIGIGPSSSHTVGPMRAAKQFTDGLESSGQLAATVRVQAELFGSLGATGRGHGSDKAVVLGLQGQSPETVDTSTADDQVAAAALDAELRIAGHHRVDFNWDEDVVLHRRKSLPAHPNGMTFRALDHTGGGAARTQLLLDRRRLRGGRRCVRKRQNRC